MQYHVLTNIVEFLDLLKLSEHPSSVTWLSADGVTTKPNHLLKTSLHNNTVASLYLSLSLSHTHTHNTFR